MDSICEKSCREKQGKVSGSTYHEAHIAIPATEGVKHPVLCVQEGGRGENNNSLIYLLE